MPPRRFALSPRQHMLVSALVLLVAAILFGGASRIDVVAPVIVRLIAVAAIVGIFWANVPQVGPSGRFVWIYWAALLALPLLQLVPLPWPVWTNLPGRELAAQIYTALGERPWQPISLTPDRTLNALFALLPALAAFLIAVRLDDEARDRLLQLACLFAVSSAVLGLLQVVGGSGSRLYFYAITNADSSVGWFSNANHNALMMCSGIVLVLCWLAGQFRTRAQLPWGKIWFAAVGLLCLFASMPLTASRAGMLLSAVALIGGVALLPLDKIGISARGFWMRAVPVLVVIGAGAGFLAFPRMFGGLQPEELFEDGRARNIGDFAAITRDYFPFGSGLGSFDPVYRVFEDVSSIQLNYLNNAHNEPAQFLIEGGVGGLALMLAFVGWWAVAAWRTWRHPGRDGRQMRQARAASLITAMLMVHSLVDYPLRTAALSVLFAFCAGIMAVRPVIATGRSRGLALPAYLDDLGESELAFSSAGRGHKRAG